MAYSRDDAIKQIVDYKKQWEEANNAGDLVGKGNAAKYASKVYEMMRANGDSAIADELSASNYTKSQGVRDKYYKMSKTETRPYLYSLGEKYGMSQSDVDAIIGWDADSGEITLGGKKIGRPDALVGGSSYWNNTDVLDKEFTDYVQRTGKVQAPTTMVGQGNEDIMNKYKQTFDTAMNENPYETPVGKSILGKYNLAALQGRENQLASGAASNGGNIDSFSAANAMRQQAALVSQGQDAALAAHQQKIDNAQKILEGMGIHVDRIYAQDETTKTREFEQGEIAKNNEVSRNVAISDVTGSVPNEWVIKNDSFYNTYLNPDGTLKEQYKNIDFQSAYNQAIEKGDKTLAHKYSVLRTAKINTWPEEFGKYFSEGNLGYIAPEETAAVKEAQKNRDHEIEIMNMSNDTNGSRRSAVSTTYSRSSGSSGSSKTSLTAAQSRDAIKAGEINETTIAAYNKHYGTNYTVDNPPPIAGTTTTTGKPLTDSQTKNWINNYNAYIAKAIGSEDFVAIQKTPAGWYDTSNADKVNIAVKILSDNSLSDEQAKQLFEILDISDDVINAAVSDRRVGDSVRD